MRVEPTFHCTEKRSLDISSNNIHLSNCVPDEDKALIVVWVNRKIDSIPSLFFGWHLFDFFSRFNIRDSCSEEVVQSMCSTHSFLLSESSQYFNFLFWNRYRFSRNAILWLTDALLSWTSELIGLQLLAEASLGTL